MGVKARSTGTPPAPMAWSRCAWRASRRSLRLPLMMHIANGPPDVSDVLDMLRPGDILTHCPQAELCASSAPIAHLDAAAALGSRRDQRIGHGAGSFSFEAAEALIAEGFRPHALSSDIHQMSILGPLFDLPTCLSKFMALGMSFPEVIEAATSRPAALLGMQNEVGTLRPGAYADIALFEILEGVFPFYDVSMTRRDGRALIRNTLTLVNGRVLPRQVEPPSAPWMPLNETQLELRARGHTPGALAAAGHRAPG